MFPKAPQGQINKVITLVLFDLIYIDIAYTA